MITFANVSGHDLDDTLFIDLSSKTILTLQPNAKITHVSPTKYDSPDSTHGNIHDQAFTYLTRNIEQYSTSCDSFAVMFEDAFPPLHDFCDIMDGLLSICGATVPNKLDKTLYKYCKVICDLNSELFRKVSKDYIDTIIPIVIRHIAKGYNHYRITSFDDNIVELYNNMLLEEETITGPAPIALDDVYSDTVDTELDTHTDSNILFDENTTDSGFGDDNLCFESGDKESTSQDINVFVKKAHPNKELACGDDTSSSAVVSGVLRPSASSGRKLANRRRGVSVNTGSIPPSVPSEQRSDHVGKHSTIVRIDPVQFVFDNG